MAKTQIHLELDRAILRQSRRYQINTESLDPESARELLRLLRDLEQDRQTAENKARRFGLPFR